MAVESESDRLALLNDFGTEITLPDTSVILGIFDVQQNLLDAGETYVTSPSPMILCRTSDVATLVKGQALTIFGSTYYVRENKPDYTGFSAIELRQ